jgi:DNA mismatch repair protein MutS2
LEASRSAAEADRLAFAEGLPARFHAAEERFLAELKSEVTRQTVRRVARREAPKAVEAAALEAGLAPNAAATALRLPAVGDRVRVAHLGLEGVVVQADRATGRLKVDCGGKSLQVGAADVTVTASGAGAAALRRSTGAEVKAREATTEINLIGKTVADATEELESFLDRASMADLPSVRVIHGVGTGRLRTGLHAFLKASPYVASFEEAPQNQGGVGATLVKLRG